MSYDIPDDLRPRLPPPGWVMPEIRVGDIIEVCPQGVWAEVIDLYRNVRGTTSYRLRPLRGSGTHATSNLYMPSIIIPASLLQRRPGAEIVEIVLRKSDT